MLMFRCTGDQALTFPGKADFAGQPAGAECFPELVGNDCESIQVGLYSSETRLKPQLMVESYVITFVYQPEIFRVAV